MHWALSFGNRLTLLGKRKVARYLFDMHDRGVYIESGHSSAIHFAKTRLGMSESEAKDTLLAGRRLQELPAVDAALLRDEIGWSKMMRIQRVAIPETETAWVELAKTSNCRQLECEVKRCHKGDLPKPKGDSGLPDLRVQVKASLMLANYQMWENARRKLSEEFRMTVTNEDMMNQVSRLILSTDADGKAEGRTAIKHSPFQLIVHRDETGTWVHTDRGDVDIEHAEAELLAAQAEVVPAAAPVKDDEGKTPHRVVKRVLARDDHRCQNCERFLHLQVHHVQWRVHGGKTEETLLASLCPTCHALVHQGLLTVLGNSRDGFCFVDRSGARVDRAVELGPEEPGSETLPETLSEMLPAVLRTALAAPPDTGNPRRDTILRSFLLVGARRHLAPRYGAPLLGSADARAPGSG